MNNDVEKDDDDEDDKDDDVVQDYDDGGLGPVGDEEDEAVMVYRERAPSPVTQGTGHYVQIINRSIAD